MSMTDAAEPGLRERKRLATRRAIQLAVLDLSAEKGLDGTTVDEISRVADISPRTFFNYFSSKEDAMLGDSPELPSAEVVEAFVNGNGPFLEDLTHVLAKAGERAMSDSELIRRRQVLIKQYPNLFALRMASMRKFEEEIGSIIERRLARTEPGLAEDAEKLADQARLATLVSFATMRHAWMRWAAGELTSSLTDQLSQSFSQLKQLLASDTRQIVG